MMQFLSAPAHPRLRISHGDCSCETSACNRPRPGCSSSLRPCGSRVALVMTPARCLKGSSRPSAQSTPETTKRLSSIALEREGKWWRGEVGTIGLHKGPAQLS